MGDVTKKVDIIVAAQDKASPTFDRISASATAAKAAAEKAGDGGGGGGSLASKLKEAQKSDLAAGLKSAGKLLHGGGAFLGFKLIAGELAQFASKAHEAAEAWKEGAISGGEFVDKIAGALPIFGQVWEAGRNIHKLFSDPEGDLARARKGYDDITASVDRLVASRRRLDLLKLGGSDRGRSSEDNRFVDESKKLAEQRNKLKEGTDVPKLSSTQEAIIKGVGALSTQAFGADGARRMGGDSREEDKRNKLHQIDIEQGQLQTQAKEAHVAALAEIDREAARKREEFSADADRQILDGQAESHEQELRERGREAEADQSRLLRELRDKAEAVQHEAAKLAGDDPAHAAQFQQDAIRRTAALVRGTETEIAASERKQAHDDAERERAVLSDTLKAKRETIVSGLRANHQEVAARLAEIEGTLAEKIQAIDHELEEANRKTASGRDGTDDRNRNRDRADAQREAARADAAAGRRGSGEQAQQQKTDGAIGIAQQRLSLLKQESELGDKSKDIEAEKLDIQIRRVEQQKHLAEMLKNESLTKEQRDQIKKESLEVEALAKLQTSRVGLGGPASVDSAVVHVQESHHLSGAAQASKEKSMAAIAAKVAADMKAVKDAVASMAGGMNNIALALTGIPLPNP